MNTDATAVAPVWQFWVLSTIGFMHGVVDTGKSYVLLWTKCAQLVFPTAPSKQIIGSDLLVLATHTHD